MYAHGWDERSGGNVSVLLDEAELAGHLILPKPKTPAIPSWGKAGAFGFLMLFCGGCFPREGEPSARLSGWWTHTELPQKN